MTLTLRHKAQAILRQAGWDLLPPPVLWFPRMARCAGPFVIEGIPAASGIWRSDQLGGLGK